MKQFMVRMPRRLKMTLKFLHLSLNGAPRTLKIWLMKPFINWSWSKVLFVKPIKLQPRTVTFWPSSGWEIRLRKSWVLQSSCSTVCLAMHQHGLCTGPNHSRWDLPSKVMMFGLVTIEATFSIGKTPICPPWRITNNFSITVSLSLASMMLQLRLIMFFQEPGKKNFHTSVTPKVRLKCSQRSPRVPIWTRNSMFLSLLLPLST